MILILYIQSYTCREEWVSGCFNVQKKWSCWSYSSCWWIWWNFGSMMMMSLVLVLHDTVRV